MSLEIELVNLVITKKELQIKLNIYVLITN
jgi:hypothetical protein